MAEALAAQLGDYGYSAWYYERDSLPGLSYLIQTRNAIDACEALVLIISPRSIAKENQIGLELLRAHETSTPIIPILNDVDFPTFCETRPDWHQIIGSIVGVQCAGAAIQPILPRIVAGLSALGIEPANKSAQDTNTQDTSADTPFAGDASNAESDSSETHALDPYDDIEFEDVFDDSPMLEDNNVVEAHFFHEHQSTGFWADVTVPETAENDGGTVRVALSHQLIPRKPLQIDIQLPRDENPTTYLRLQNVIAGYPIVLRLYRLRMLQPLQGAHNIAGVSNIPAVRIDGSGERVISQSAVGAMVNGTFYPVIRANSPLPMAVARPLKTKRDNQRMIVLQPAVQSNDGTIKTFPLLRIPVMAAPAGVPWFRAIFRVDPDGRFTVVIRDPLRNMAVCHSVVAQ